MKPEVPWALAGTLSLVGGFVKSNGWPPNGTKSIAATLTLVVLASLSEGTSLEKAVNALGWLAVMGIALVAVPEIVQHAQSGKTRPLAKAAETSGKAL